MCVWGILIKTGKQFTNDFSNTKVHQDQISLNNLFVLIIDGRLKPHQGQLIFFFVFKFLFSTLNYYVSRDFFLQLIRLSDFYKLSVCFHHSTHSLITRLQF